MVEVISIHSVIGPLLGGEEVGLAGGYFFFIIDCILLDLSVLLKLHVVLKKEQIFVQVKSLIKRRLLRGSVEPLASFATSSHHL